MSATVSVRGTLEMKRGWLPVLLGCMVIGGAAAQSPRATLYEEAKCASPETALDGIVFKSFAKAGVRPMYCTDAVFLRRAYLDVIGTLPTADEARAFLSDTSLNKRRALVERLLERDEFADYWAMKWSDLLRVKAEFPVNLWPNAAQAYHRWLRASIRDNKPYDRFARELLTSNGSNFRVGPVNFYRAIQDRSPEGIATAVALTFMGCRAENWPSNTLAGMSVFFSQVNYKPTREWKEEIVYWDPDKAAAGATQVGELPDRTRITLTPGRDPREVFADWLITPKNQWFTANIVNRIWSWLLGRGIIHEPDDIRSDNPASNPALLLFLRREFARSGCDTKHLFRLILTSRTYQLSSFVAPEKIKLAAPLFAFYPLRQLDAEVLIDAINAITGTSDLYTSAIPEPFTFIPANKPAIALPDGSITSPFLELFGRPARATGLENERVNKPSASQRMHLLNSSHIQRKFETGPNMKRLLDPARKPKETIEELYLSILSRFPTPDEIAAVESYMKSGVAKRNEVGIDLAWALINSDEFLFRH
ncbi:MAG TPA: DUF1553 domain-containing protein [Kiritimatiellia bacterium]|nr:MAG: hypothetical protein BWX70_00205 [Verrucomicrobia bacterium ADurb.Bin070]HPB10276.1 DUF1553 domain-containing protein [Kiritimatiellia bacterium]HQL49919.1 DUF1553 domain-containing protein [Kiritimatiellia bacterium]